MITTHNYPNKKLSRIKNPFESSQALDSNYSDSKLSNNDSNKHYDHNKLSNVFQYNDRSRVMISDSQLGSQINNNNQSGQNIYSFSNFKNQQKVQQIPERNSSSIKTPTFPLNKYQFDQMNQQNNKISNPQYKQTSQKQFDLSKKEQNIKKSPLYQSQTNTITLNYQAPQVKMYKFNNNQIQNKQKYIYQQQQNNLEYNKFLGKTIYSNPQIKDIKQQKKTFKPSLFKQLQQQIQNDQNNKAQKIIINDNKIKNVFNKNFNVVPSQFQRKSQIPKKSYQTIKQQISDQNADIFISPSQHQSLMARDKQKAKILEEDKLNLSDGSQNHSYIETILDSLRPPNQQIEVPFQSRNSGTFNKEIYNSKKIVESKVFQQQVKQYQKSQNFKPASKKPRKRIFQPQTEKSVYNHSTNYTKTQPYHHSPYVSQFQRQKYREEKNISPSQILMKSLNIIDKMATQRSTNNSKLNQKTESQVVIVPPAPLTITQTQPNMINIYSPSVEQMNLRKQVLDLNFEVSTIETTFDLQTFDSRQQIMKINYLNQAATKLFYKYKNLILNGQQLNFQSSLHTNLKQEILLLRQTTTKLVNFQQKYIQTKHILQSFEEQIKDILLLSSKQKYKKIKLLNQAIQVIQKTQTYLSLQIGKIPVLLKSFINKQKLLLQELRDWLKQCINKQNSI